MKAYGIEQCEGRRGWISGKKVIKQMTKHRGSAAHTSATSGPRYKTSKICENVVKGEIERRKKRER